MSTSLLYRAFGIRGYEYRRTDYVDDRVCFTLEQPRESYRCPTCGSAAVHAQGHKDRSLQTIPIGLKPAVSGISMRLRFADTLEEHQEGVLAFYDYPISTGPLEGINNKI